MIHEAVKKALAGTKSGAVVLAVLGIVLCTSKSIGPILEPFLVGRWEATINLDSNAGVREPRQISFSLYDDNVVLFDGLKGSWRLIDVSRPTVLIEIPRQDTKPDEIFEFQIQREPPLQFWGTLRHSGKELRFAQVEKGGAIGVIAEAIRQEQRAAQSFAEETCKQRSWRRTAYALYHYSRYDGPWVSCGNVG